MKILEQNFEGVSGGNVIAPFAGELRDDGAIIGPYGWTGDEGSRAVPYIDFVYECVCPDHNRNHNAAHGARMTRLIYADMLVRAKIIDAGIVCSENKKLQSCSDACES